MKAMVFRQYGPPEVLHVEEVAKPVPGEHDVLIRVHATSVTAADYRVRGFKVPPGFWIPARVQFGITHPRHPILGVEMAGVVEAVGGMVTRFRPGDAVFGTSSLSATYAEYVCWPETAPMVTKPDNLSFEEAAAVPFGAQTAYYFLHHRAQLRRGQKVLVYGASGGVGTAAVQLARHVGAEVTGVCSGPNLKLVRSLGARRAIDYTRTDFTTEGLRYDVIMDTVGRTHYGEVRDSLTDKGIYIAVNGELPELLLGAWTAMRRGQRVISAIAHESVEDLEQIRRIIEDGGYRPVIDRTYRLEEAADAHRYADQGHKRGNVVLSLDYLIEEHPVAA